ncbi:MAG: hypothetical protein GY749_42590 [Desulfobacteraceae bacterium]|nr:hypothetical protein [Desulfobacteraceae bacterium]
MYNEDCLQALLDTWWESDENEEYKRGRLIRAFIPHVDQIPYSLIPTGREKPTEHNAATVRLVPLNPVKANKLPKLPVAAIPQYSGEIRAVYRAKKRPAVILCSGGAKTDRSLTLNKAKWQTNRTVIVAPYYGADEGKEKRSGFSPVFIDRIKRCEYPQYMWDKLPLDGSTESVLRLDHMQPVGRSRESIELTPFCLSSKALMLLDEWTDWLIKGKLVFGKDSEDLRLGDIRKLLLEL